MGDFLFWTLSKLHIRYVMILLITIKHVFMSEEEVIQQAIEFAKRNKKRIAQELTDPAVYEPDLVATSVFMAGSPGAGKTEFSKKFIALFEREIKHRVLRIDPDEIRSLIPGYVGSNSYLFQRAVSLIVEKIHDCALHNKQTFVFDGTFSRYEKAVENIQRSLKLGRSVLIFYVYQHPELAWQFTQAREVQEGRNIPKSAFVDQFIGVRDVIRRVRQEFGDEVVVKLVKKDLDNRAVESTTEIKSKGHNIDDFLPDTYTKEELEKLL